MKYLLTVLILLAAAVATWTFLHEEPPREGNPTVVDTPTAPRPHERLDAPAHPAPPDLPDAPPPPPPLPVEPEAGPPSTVLAGSVLTPAGNPLPGAMVQLFREVDSAPGARGRKQPIAEPVVTDARGGFRFDALKGGSHYLVRVEHGSYAPSEQRGVVVAVEQENVLPAITMQGGVRIVGTVKDERAIGVERATVAVYAVPEAASAAPAAQVLTDAHGDYAFPNLAPGSYQVTVARKGLRSRRSEVLELTSARAEVRQDFTLEPGLKIDGRISEAGGGPIAGARVEARRMLGDPAVVAATSTRSDGVFRLDGLGKERYRITIRATGYAQAQRQPVEPGDTVLAVQLIKNAGVSGFVTDSSGENPVKSFGLILWSVGRNDRLNEPVGAMREFQHTADGSFTIDDVPAGDYRLQAFANDFAPTFTPTFSVKRLYVQAGKIRLDKGSKLLGRVLDGEGKPIAGASVRMFDNAYTVGPLDKVLYGNMSETAKPVETDAEGRFAFEQLAAGAVQLRIGAAGKRTLWRKDVAVAAGTDNDAGDFVLTVGGNLKGNVSTSGGGPARGAKVYLMLADGTQQELTVDREGAFLAENLPAGDCTVTAVPSGNRNPLEVAIDSYKQQQKVTIVDGVTVAVSFTVKDA